MRRRDTTNLDTDTRRKNHEWRARYGEVGHPELALQGEHRPYGGRGTVSCSNLLQVLAILSFMPRREELVRWVKSNWPLSTRTLPPRMGVHAAVRAARAGKPHPLLVEAVCRMSGIQLLVHLPGTGGQCWHFGVSGPIHQVLRETIGRYTALIRPTPRQYVDTDECLAEMERYAFEPPLDVLRGEDDGHSSGDEMEAEPAPPEPEDFFDPNPDFNEFNPFPFPLPHQDPEPQPDPELPPTNNDPVPDDESGAAQPHHYWLRRPRSPRQPRRREQQRPQPFRPHNIESMRPEHQAELSAPSTDAYQVCENNLIWCRLPGCARSSAPFKTVRAWKIHVRRAACHQQETLCTWCGHVIAMPSEHLSEDEIKVVMDSHRTERCIGASKRTMEARKTAAARLMILGRDNSHFAVPEEGADEVMVSNPRKRHLTSEAARRADQCCSFLKRFKEDNPDLMEQIGAEYQLHFD